jgi:undecaprenyl-diphosphatase
VTLFQALVVGIVQGLTEFLPISSSGHLFLTPWLFGWGDHGLAFDVSLHLGTLVAVLWYFNHEWKILAASGWGIVRTRRVETPEQRRVIFLILATIPGALGGLLLEDYAETVFRSPTLIASNLALFGILLWLVDRYATRARTLDVMRHRDALLVGLAQVLALVPGVSRSGSTITASRALGLTREAAAVFSFLMLAPITLGAVVLKMPEAVRQADDMLPLITGIVAAAVSGWLAIAVLLRIVARRSYGVFAAYRVALAMVIFALIYFRGL